ncbi:ribonuclease H family protein [Bifidobacterium callitrichidarum]|uniref:ribonuclease H n=1 Tax=Bifidobacterium callitrichidarum TaxID=2052941 RepID=A0A2U2NBT4_9BIFI|nr:ribonuclease H [Bifidobacterium callitrichidarum]PWG66582.1 ribonuclease HI [Bifidobacterium callitrichidarum]
MTITVSTDGSALGNPNGPMGWAWADHEKNAGGKPGHEHDDHGYDSGGATNGTNQIGELCAVLEALRAHPGSEPLLIESDSQYAINCSTTWVKGWKRNGWKNSQKKSVKNVELIKAIDAEISRRPGPVSFKWVKGHAGNAGNELVDELARTYAGDCRSGARDGYLPLEGWQSLLHSEYSRGTDVPPDVQLVLDGQADASSLRKPVESGTTQTGKVGESGKSGGSPAKSRGGQSLADLLAEPEGVPDLDFGDRQTGDATDPTDAMRQAGTGTATGTTFSAADQQTSLSPATTPKVTSVNDNAATPAGRQSHSSAPTATAPVTTATTTSAKPSGLTVSGTLVFSPAPKTSPYFNGQPMPISGIIAIEGYVDGDGNLTITNAPFMRQ